MSLGIANLLLEFGVYTQSTNIRLARAAALAKAGITEDDVRIVAAHIEATSDAGKLPPFLGAVVNDPARFVEMAADVRHYHLKREERQRANVATHTNGVPMPWPTCRCKECFRLVSEGRPWPAAVTKTMEEAGRDQGCAASARSADATLRVVR